MCGSASLTAYRCTLQCDRAESLFLVLMISVWGQYDDETQPHLCVAYRYTTAHFIEDSATLVTLTTARAPCLAVAQLADRTYASDPSLFRDVDMLDKCSGWTDPVIFSDQSALSPTTRGVRGGLLLTT